MTVQTTTTPGIGPETASRRALVVLDGGPRAAARPLRAVPRSGRLDVRGDAQQSRLARYATDAAHHDVVRLFEYARLGRSAVRCEQVGLAEVLARVSVLLQHRGVRPAQVAIAREMPVVSGDPGLLELVFTFLLGGIGPDSCVAVAWRRTNSSVLVGVNHDRQALPPREARRTAAPLEWPARQRDDSAWQRLGLAAAKRAVALQTGAIWRDSAVGAGNTYFVRLPLAEARGPSHR